MPTHIDDKLISWASQIDDGTIRQAQTTARLPVVAGHVALMPDAHIGLGATVGSVIPTDGAVIPSAVGVDIGCGMIAAELDLTGDQLPDTLDPLLGRIEQVIPAGVGRAHDQGTIKAERWLADHSPATSLSAKQASTAARQFGTLGSGNHFFELCLDERGRVWVVLHSGSRGIGNQLAQMHIGRAKQLARDLRLRLEDPALAYFLDGTPEFHAYVTDMLWAQDYARANRDQMMDRAMVALFTYIGHGHETRRINCFAGDTRVITRQGTMPIAELSGGIHELLTDAGTWVKAPVSSFGRQPLMKLTVTRCGRQKEILATPEHGWLVQTRRGLVHATTTSGLQPGDRLASTWSPRPAEMTPDGEGIARGFVFGDGSLGPYRARANFYGSKDRAVLPYFSGWRAPRVYKYNDESFVVVNGLPREWKTDTPSLESEPSQLYGWLAGYFAADGDVDKTGRPTLSSARREHLEYVRDLCNVVGIGTYGIRRHVRQGYGSKPTPLFLLGLMRNDLDSEFFLLRHHRERFEACAVAERRSWYVVSVEDAGCEEEVFCATVPETHCFALEDNILTQNCHHNFTQRETHGGRELWITRKGAIKADVGDLGVIPGSMGTRSYIVAGKGNAASWTSCAHGAGRRYSRTKAKQLFGPDDLTRAMAGKVWQTKKAKALVDEIPSAYKDIDQVMADQTDLVEIQHTLHQVLNYKGT